MTTTIINPNKLLNSIGRKYLTIEDAGKSNFTLIKKLFSESNYEILGEDFDQYSPYDGLLIDKDNKDNAIYIEVKIREFSNQKLINDYNSSFYLEEHKYNSLHSSTLNSPHSNYLIWYICATVDGYIYIFDIKDKQLNWKSIKANKVTYTSDPEKVNKRITELNINDAKYKIKL